jgi:carbon storage regulator CsrA
MLVISRRKNESIRFPSLGISVHVCRIAGNVVRIGVDAPRNVRILRTELCDHATVTREPETLAGDERCHQLNAVRVALALAKKQLDCGRAAEAEGTLSRVVADLDQLHQVDAPDTPIQEQASTANDATSQPVKRALVVEDNANERELLAGYLRLSGFRVDTAANGLEAIRYLSSVNELPQAVVLDLKMPPLDGPKTVSDIRFRTEMQGLKLFAVSGSTPAEMNVPIGPQGVDRWFDKPINPRSLVEQINVEIEENLEVDENSPGYVWPLGVTYAPRGRRRIPA